MFVDSLPNLYVSDIGRAIAFYRDLLGFVQTYQYPREGRARHVELRLGTSAIALSTAEALESYGLPPATRGQPFELAVAAEDTDAAVDKLRSAGVPVVREPFDSANGQRVSYVTDLDGNRVHIYSNP